MVSTKFLLLFQLMEGKQFNLQCSGMPYFCFFLCRGFDYRCDSLFSAVFNYTKPHFGGQSSVVPLGGIISPATISLPTITMAQLGSYAGSDLCADHNGQCSPYVHCFQID